MDMMQDLSTKEIMNTYANILYALNARKVIRTYNSPVGDYAEWLVKEKLSLKLENNSKKGYDAIGEKTGIRYQIKSRWERGKASRTSRELNVIRNYRENHFDYLIVIIFGDNFNIKEAYEIPHSIIGKYAKPDKHQNGYILTALGDVLKDSEVKNITDIFK